MRRDYPDLFVRLMMVSSLYLNKFMVSRYSSCVFSFRCSKFEWFCLWYRIRDCRLLYVTCIVRSVVSTAMNFKVFVVACLELFSGLTGINFVVDFTF